MARYGRFSRFGQPRPKPAVTTSTNWPLRKARKCDKCGVKMAAGDLTTRFMLSKRYRGPCTQCGKIPNRTKYYHKACAVGLDPNTAMGHNPNPTAAPPPSGASTPPPPPRGSAVPPPIPQKPPTLREASLNLMVAFEATLKAKIGNPKNATPEQKAIFEKYNRMKARALNPASVAEGETSMGFAFRELIKVIYNDTETRQPSR